MHALDVWLAFVKLIVVLQCKRGTFGLGSR